MPPKKGKTPSKATAAKKGASAASALAAPWAASASDVASAHGVDPANGLTSAAARDALARHGPNELDKEDGKPLWKLVLEQFDDALVKILLAAAAVSFALVWVEDRAPGAPIDLVDFVEPGVILLILILNAIVGVWQESNAENALEALKEMQSDTARVLRDGKWDHAFQARDLVPGDVVEVRTGDRVPADARVVTLKTATIRLEQASLTGESVAVNKDIDAIDDPDAELQAKGCMLFGGTAASQGACVAIVTHTGMRTEIGKIQAQIQAASEEEEDTPLKQKLDRFGDQLTWGIGLVCLFVWLMNYQFFISWKRAPGSFVPYDVEFNFAKCTFYFKIAVALAVAAIPEGLPAVITTCLALGTRKMAKKNAIVRKLQSVETLGCTSVICSDKTGTLTTNNMSAVKLVVPTIKPDVLKTYDVTGTSYDASDGAVVGAPKPTKSKPLDASLAAVSKVCRGCNDAVIEMDAHGHAKCAGQPTEGALRVLASKLERGAKTKDDDFKKMATLEFDRDRKSMSVVIAPTGGGKANANANELLVKGAPEHVLERCAFVQLPNGDVVPLTKAARAAVVKRAETMSADALRCLALATKSGASLGALASYDGATTHAAHASLADASGYAAIESDLVFVGLAGLRDPPRPEVRGAVAACASAGIRVVVITGDNRLTAEAICVDIGVFDSAEDVAGRSFTGREFGAMTKAKQIAALTAPGGCVCSRAEPKHKQDIVRLLKERGEIVAMTGDGVNDAPALKLADIGIAMGITGTAVAKEASDMVLADDNFSSIVDAISEGRSIYNNMKAFIRYMISSNVGEVVSIFLTAALGMPEGLIPVQLLWVNLVTDGPPATALGFNPPDVDIMTKTPRKKDEDLISAWALVRYLVVGLYVGAATVGVFAVWYTRSSFLGIDLSGDGHTTVTWHQLSHWGECASWGSSFKGGKYSAGGATFDYTSPANKCDYFTEGKAKASTLSLTTLVVIEMFNACNALSEVRSIFPRFQSPPSTPFNAN